jgi:hypothetical protein
VPSPSHEAPLELLRACPSLLKRLLVELLGVELPPHLEDRVEEGDLTQLTPTELHADVVIALDAVEAQRAFIVEVQRQVDRWKGRTWLLRAGRR